MRDEDEARARAAVSQLLRTHRDAIVADWMRLARSSATGALSEPLLRDHVPQVVLEIAGVVAQEEDDLAAARLHAVERLHEGFDLGTVVGELSMLRRCVFDVLRRVSTDVAITGLAAVDSAIDRAIAVSVERYAHAKTAARETALAKLESLLAASPIGIAFVDRELRYVRINDALAAINGRPPAEHIGRTVAEILPAHAAQLEALLRHVLETGEPVANLEVEVPGPSPAESTWLLGNYFAVRMSNQSIIGVGAIVVDITATKRTQVELASEQTRLRSIIEHAPAAIWVKEPGGRVLVANNQLAEALGHPLEDVIGRRSDEILSADLAQQHQAHDARVYSEGQAIEVEEQVPSPNGPRTFLSIKFPIPGDPPLVGAIATEITERKRMEEELRSAIRTREDILAVVSHDLRNPLATVQLSSSMLASQTGLDARGRRHLELVHRACVRMENLINDLLDTANIRAGRFRVSLQREVVADVVNEALDLQMPLAAEKGIELVRRCELAGVHVACDRERIIQVFANLIGNALKFCRAGDTVTITCEPHGTDAVFEVADTGPGIDAERAAQIFDAHWSAPEHAGHGKGLGLFIVRGIIESHGGHIWLESTPGAGARFRFTLPRA